MVFRPLAGCGLFPSGRCLRHGLSGVSVPLRGVGCFMGNSYAERVQREFPSPCGVWVVSRAGYHVVVFNLFPSPCGVWVVSLMALEQTENSEGFPSPCGVRVVSEYNKGNAIWKEFPSPCGVWVVSILCRRVNRDVGSFRPLAGCGLFRPLCSNSNRRSGFRPLAGCGLFLGCNVCKAKWLGFRPLAGCGLFQRGY